MLKLDSDNVNKGPIDVRLEMEELSAIEEDLNSARSSLFVPTEIRRESSHPSHHSHHSQPSQSVSTKLHKIDEKSEKSGVSQPPEDALATNLPLGFSVKQLALLAVALVVALMLGVSMAS